MKLRDKLKLSLQARFGLAILLSLIVFIVVLLIMFGSFVQVRSDIHNLVTTKMELSSDSAQLARELLQFITRLKQLETSFYGDDEHLLAEGAVLLKMSRHHSYLHADSKLLTNLEPLTEQLVTYLDHCHQINELLRWLRREESALKDVFSLLEQEVVTKPGKGGGDQNEQQYLIASFRISLLEIIQANERKKPKEYFASGFFDPPPGAAQLNRLKEQMRVLLQAEPPADRLGRQLIDQLGYYQQLAGRFQQEMIHLGRLSTEISRLTDAILVQMEELSWEQEVQVEETEDEVDATILATGSLILILLLMLGVMLGLIQLNLFSQHVKKPMEKIRRRLQEFKQGDFSSPMLLQRSDEWGQIESVFNDMLEDLTQSWSAVQESEKRYRNIFDSASIGIFQSKIDGTLLHLNPTLAIIFGVDAYADLSDLKDLGEMVYVNPEDRERMMQRLLQEEVVSNFEVQLRRKNGELFWAEINSHVVLDSNDQIQMIEGTVDDISQRRQAEDELRKLKEYLQDIIDTMPSILVGVNEELQVTLWNWQVANVTGVSEADAQGKSLEAVFDLIDLTEIQKTVCDTLEIRSVVRLSKVSGTNAGAGRVYDLLIYPLSTSEASGVVIHMDDVTEKAQFEEVMVQSEKMLSVGSLAAGMAHEINNPLASVLQNVQVMKQRLSPALKKNQQVAEQLGISIEQVVDYTRLRGFDKMIRSIADSGQRAARIIENMLNFSRKSSPNFIPCSLAELVEKTIELAASDYDMKHHFDFRTINLVREFQPLPDVPCESSQVQQVVLSLLKNAAQALGQHEEKQIVIRLYRQEERACLEIEDNGEGMDAETQRRIFEPFYSTKEVGHGAGLGLSVGYFLINENHNGSLTVTSEPGKGTCFRILLPLTRV